MRSEISQAFASAKRNCVLCHTYKTFRPSDTQKEMAMASTKRAYDLLRDAFDIMRKENAPLTQLDAIRAAKVLALDSMDACGSCDKQRPRIKEILIDVK
jgi:hypothetical protein